MSSPITSTSSLVARLNEYIFSYGQNLSWTRVIFELSWTAMYGFQKESYSSGFPVYLKDFGLGETSLTVHDWFLSVYKD